MGDAVGFMELGYCFFERWKGGDFDLGKYSESLSLEFYQVFGGGSAHSASNWLGKIRSASRKRFLYAGTTSSLI